MDDRMYFPEASSSGHPVSWDIFNFAASSGNTTEERCYSARSHSTVLQGLPFGGIPTVLAINFVLWLILLLVFSCLRKAAWDYGRLALLMDNDSLTSLFYGEQSEKEKSPSETSPSDLDSRDVGFCSWLTSIYHMKDEEIQTKCGVDATTYLSFQRHVLVLLMIMCVLSIAVILPVNFSGDLLGDSPAHFGRTTIANVPTQDRLLWLHSIFSLLYFILTVLCMAHHSLQLEYKEDEKVARTLMITQIPKEISDPSLVVKHFHEAYPSCTVTDVQFCFDVRRLMKLDAQRRKAMKGRLYFAAKAQNEGKIMIKTHPCARIFCCDSCGFEQGQAGTTGSQMCGMGSFASKILGLSYYGSAHCAKYDTFSIYVSVVAMVDAEQYYAELEEKLTDEFNAERNRITLKRLDIAFVTFQDDRMTAVIIKDYNRTPCRRSPQQSSVTTVMKAHTWGVQYAHAPNDIIWENLSLSGSFWWVRFIILNICLFILLFFLTTPAIIVNTMDKFNVTHPVESLKNPIVTEFFPTLLLWAFSVFLPFVVYYSAFFESHWTRSHENQLTMHKCYFFLVFMVIILPSLGLTSLDLFFRWLFDIHFLEEADIKFHLCHWYPACQGTSAHICGLVVCVSSFLIMEPSLVNYVITASLIGTAMELLRIPGLIVYATRLCFAKSEPERLHIKRSQAYEFQFGLEYAWTTCIFAVVTTYSITCPIIVPFGLLYMLLKHLVDRYNIYYAYIPTKLSQRIHTAAVSQVIVAPVLCMFWLLFFSVLRLGPTRPVTLFTFVVLLCCILFSLFGLCLKKLHPKKPSSYQLSEQADGTFNDLERSSVSSTPNSNMFVATVLQEPEMGLTPAASPAHQSYGTMGNRVEPAPNSEDDEEGLQSFEADPENGHFEYGAGPLIDTDASYH